MQALICTYSISYKEELLAMAAGGEIIVCLPGGHNEDYALRCIDQAQAVKRVFKDKYNVRLWCPAHVKYYIFRKGGKVIAYVGSMNLTRANANGQSELLMECTPEQADELVKLHDFAFRKLSFELPLGKESKKLDGHQLSSLVSTPVRP